MINTRDRQEDKNKFDTSYASRPYNTDYNESVYAENRRVTNDSYYQNTYEQNYGYNNFNNQNSSMDFDNYIDNSTPDLNVFDYNDYVKENAMHERKAKAKSKEGAKLSVRAKVLVGVYFALITLIVVMLLVNTIPSVGAQSAVASNPNPEVKVSEEGFNNSYSNVANGSDVVIYPPYDYDTKTNWFDNFCDFINNIFA